MRNTTEKQINGVTFDVRAADGDLILVSTSIDKVYIATYYMSEVALRLCNGVTNLDVSFKAAESVAYFPPLPTVIAPDGGDDAHVADRMRETVETENDKSEVRRTILDHS